MSAFLPEQVAELPTVVVPMGTQFARIHRADRDPRHFSCGVGRFDPRSERGSLGACYVADDALAAFVEVYRRIRTISETELATRRLSTLKAARVLVLVDLTSRQAGLAGPDTSALSSQRDYDETQAFAAAVADAGRDGIRYFARHDPAKALVCHTIFGSHEDEPLAVFETEMVPEQLVRRAGDEFGYVVVPVP